MTLSWYINVDHFATDAPEGRYEYGDWGNGRAYLTMPGQSSRIVPWDDARTIAQAHQDSLAASEVAA